MKILSIHDLPTGTRHVLDGVVPGAVLTKGGLNFKPPGHRSHDVDCGCPACDGEGRHVHADEHEVFIILQGKARLEVDGKSFDLKAGDVAICDPGEDHHVVSDLDAPCVNLYLHAGDVVHPKQRST